MTLVLETVTTESISQLSYLIGDDSSGTAAVIDPRPDCEIYLRLARRHGVSITHVFETHIHADFMSGARELAARSGSSELYVSEIGGPQYGFDHMPLRDGDRFSFGSVQLTARHTPGHTPEHVSYEIAEAEHPDDPWAVFTGDSLFVGSAGRPDLVHDERGKALPGQLFETLSGYYRRLDDGVLILPGHGAGSACGADIGDRPMSSIGYERRHNPFLQYSDQQSFKEFVESGSPSEPSHYSRLKQVNEEGPPTLMHLPPCPAMPPQAFREAIDSGGSTLLDVRSVLDFGGGHIDGALNIANRSELSTWAGWMLDADCPVLLVLDDDADLEEVCRRLLRVGLVRFAGYLAGGMVAWEKAGFDVVPLPQMSVHDLRRDSDGLHVLDVRSEDEFESGHVPGAIHVHVPELPRRLGELKSDRPYAVFCGSGYRASIAASMLQQYGFEDVRNVIGSWKAWTAAEFPVEESGKG